MDRVFTVAEVARLLKAIDGRNALTRRAIRYYDRSGMVQPSGRLPGRRGARLYTLIDIGLLRIAWLLRARFQVSDRGAWAILVLQGDTLRQHLATGEGGVTVDDPTPLRSRGAEDQRADRPICVSAPIRLSTALALPPALVRHAMTLRREQPELWTGSAWVEARAVLETVR
jgi:DNA-binding transcriptional MerR regulator